VIWSKVRPVVLVLWINGAALVSLIAAYLALNWGHQLSMIASDWYSFFQFVATPMTLSVAGSALYFSYQNYSLNQAKYESDRIRSDIDSKVKLLENLYPRYLDLIKLYHEEFRKYSEVKSDIRKTKSENKLSGLGWTEDDEASANEMLEFQGESWEKAYIDWINCQKVSLDVARSIPSDTDQGKSLSRFYLQQFENEYFDDRLVEANRYLRRREVRDEKQKRIQAGLTAEDGMTEVPLETRPK
jgi:hypothetical protein